MSLVYRAWISYKVSISNQKWGIDRDFGQTRPHLQFGQVDYFTTLADQASQHAPLMEFRSNPKHFNFQNSQQQVWLRIT